VLKDPPFSRLDLISCRNFLIYIDRELQQRVISIFHYALLSDGYLFLGSSESAEHPEGLFRTVDRSARIFQSTGKRGVDFAQFPRLMPNARFPEPPSVTVPGERSRAEIPQQHRQALTELGPPSILVDENHRVQNLSEKAGVYLLHPPGPPTIDIADLVRPELSSEMLVLLNRAFQHGESAMSLPIPVQFNGHSRYVCIQVSPLRTATAPPRALVLFIESGPAQMAVETGLVPATPDSEDTVKRLQEELLATRANLKTTRQQFETATENLRAANEELQSINEEYRSTAEELETSREELQSMNEELQTVNAELKSNLDAVSRAHNDLENLMIATDVGTLFLDSELRIKRFTPRTRELFNINSTDEGRQISDFTNRLNYADFEIDARNVMQRKHIVRKSVRAGNRWYLIQMHPYQTSSGEVEGVVATFVDTTPPEEEQPAKRNAKPRRQTKKAARR
jgi:two-component system CheB/CheR fusion protein